MKGEPYISIVKYSKMIEDWVIIFVITEWRIVFFGFAKDGRQRPAVLKGLNILDNELAPLILYKLAKVHCILVLETLGFKVCRGNKTFRTDLNDNPATLAQWRWCTNKSHLPTR